MSDFAPRANKTQGVDQLFKDTLMGLWCRLPVKEWVNKQAGYPNQVEAYQKGTGCIHKPLLLTFFLPSN